MSSELVERLRDYGLTLEPNVVICDRRVVDEASARIEALEAENARLREALDKMVVLYESEYDPDFMPPRPAWLQEAIAAIRSLKGGRDAQ